MSFGTSIFLIAVGAILRFAVYVSASGFSIHTIGVILMAVGGAGLILSILWISLWSDRARGRGMPDAAGVPGRERDLYREREPY